MTLEIGTVVEYIGDTRARAKARDINGGRFWSPPGTKAIGVIIDKGYGSPLMYSVRINIMRGDCMVHETYGYYEFEVEVV